MTAATDVSENIRWAVARLSADDQCTLFGILARSVLRRSIETPGPNTSRLTAAALRVGVDSLLPRETAHQFVRRAQVIDRETADEEFCGLVYTHRRGLTVRPDMRSVVFNRLSNDADALPTDLLHRTFDAVAHRVRRSEGRPNCAAAGCPCFPAAVARCRTLPSLTGRAIEAHRAVNDDEFVWFIRRIFCEDAPP